MYEVEVKVHADHDRVRERLRELDADVDRSIVQEDTYYDAPDRSFAETDEALRIRRESDQEGSEGHGDRTKVTYKGPKVDQSSKTREEHETEIGDGETMDRLLRSLGYDPAATVRKERTVYVLDGFEVTLDRVENLGEFVEVDAEVAEGEVAETREAARELLVRLDLDPDDGIRTSYLGLVLGEDEG